MQRSSKTNADITNTTVLTLQHDSASHDRALRDRAAAERAVWTPLIGPFLPDPTTRCNEVKLFVLLYFPLLAGIDLMSFRTYFVVAELFPLSIEIPPWNPFATEVPDAQLRQWLVITHVVFVALTLCLCGVCAFGRSRLAGWTARVLLVGIAVIGATAFGSVVWLPFIKKKWSQLILTCLVLPLTPNLDQPLFGGGSGGVEEREPPFERWPLFVLKMLLFLPYANAGWHKLAAGGWEWMAGESLRCALSERYAQYEMPLARLVVTNPFIGRLLATATLCFELGAWLTLFVPRLHAVAGISALSFHIGVSLGSFSMTPPAPTTLSHPAIIQCSDDGFTPDSSYIHTHPLGPGAHAQGCI